MAIRLTTCLVLALPLLGGCSLLLERSEYVGAAEGDAGPGPMDDDAGTPPPATDAGCECGGDTPFCAGERCVQCTADVHCTGRATCDTAAGACVSSCASADECGTNEACVEGRCAPCDADGDGFARDLADCDPAAEGALDCDDADPSVHPGAVPICGDGVRQGCEGGDELPAGFAEAGRVTPFAFALPSAAGGTSVYLRALEVVPLDDGGDPSQPDGAVLIMTDGPRGPDAELVPFRTDTGEILDERREWLAEMLGMTAGLPGLGTASRDGRVLLSAFDGGSSTASLLDLTGWTPGDDPSAITPLASSGPVSTGWPDPQMRIASGDGGPVLAWRECGTGGGADLYRMSATGGVTSIHHADLGCGDRTTLAAGGGLVVAEAWDTAGHALALWTGGSTLATFTPTEPPNGQATLVELPGGAAILLVPTASGVETAHVDCAEAADPLGCASFVGHTTFGGGHGAWGEVVGAAVDAERAVFFTPAPSRDAFGGQAIAARFVDDRGRVMDDGGVPLRLDVLDEPDVGAPISLVDRLATATVERDGGVEVLLAAEVEPHHDTGVPPFPRDVWVTGVRFCRDL